MRLKSIMVFRVVTFARPPTVTHLRVPLGRHEPRQATEVQLETLTVYHVSVSKMAGLLDILSPTLVLRGRFPIWHAINLLVSGESKREASPLAFSITQEMDGWMMSSVPMKTSYSTTTTLLVLVLLFSSTDYARR